MSHTVTGTITAEPVRIGSQFGNPQFVVTVDHRTYQTEPSAQVGYTATNYGVGAVVTLTFNGSGNIVRITDRNN